MDEMRRAALRALFADAKPWETDDENHMILDGADDPVECLNPYHGGGFWNHHDRLRAVVAYNTMPELFALLERLFALALTRRDWDCDYGSMELNADDGEYVRWQDILAAIEGPRAPGTGKLVRSSSAWLGNLT